MTTYEARRVITRDNTQDQIEIAIQAVETAMRNILNSEVDVLRDASQHILNAGGKRVRPRLLMLAYMACGGNDFDYAAPAGGAVELMHTASVVHDDINDHGVVRRGRPSVNAKWGRTFALLTGDFLFTAVYQLMAPYGELNAVLAKAATALVEGETLQAAAVKENNLTTEVYMRVIALKTAALFEAAGELGGRLAGADEDQIKGLKRYAYNVGLAFQIVDDILDIVGDEEKLGKTAGIDIEQGRGIASVQSDDKSEMMDNIKAKLLEGDRLQRARQQAEMLVQSAIQALDVLPENDARDELVTLAHLIIDREY